MTNKKTAELMIEIMKYVIEFDYYPNDYFTLLELQKELFNDLISNVEYDSKINELRLNWIK
jgi:hypothetical protein